MLTRNPPLCPLMSAGLDENASSSPCYLPIEQGIGEEEAFSGGDVGHGRVLSLSVTYKSSVGRGVGCGWSIKLGPVIGPPVI